MPAVTPVMRPSGMQRTPSARGRDDLGEGGGGGGRGAGAVVVRRHGWRRHEWCRREWCRLELVSARLVLLCPPISTTSPTAASRPRDGEAEADGARDATDALRAGGRRAAREGLGEGGRSRGGTAARGRGGRDTTRGGAVQGHETPASGSAGRRAARRGRGRSAVPRRASTIAARQVGLGVAAGEDRAVGDERRRRRPRTSRSRRELREVGGVEAHGRDDLRVGPGEGPGRGPLGRCGRRPVPPRLGVGFDRCVTSSASSDDTSAERVISFEAVEVDGAAEVASS